MKYIFFTFFIFCIACKSEEVQVDVKPENVKEAPQKTFQITDEISTNTLVSGQWQVEIVLDNGRIDEKSEWKGSGLSFSESGTYDWKGVSSGDYTLDTIKNMIFLNASSPELNSEWSIKYKKNVMVWIGTPTYGHHSLQMKLVGKF